jgi:acetamidase/formamidase
MQTVVQLQAALTLYVHALPCLSAIDAALMGRLEFHVRSDLHLKSFRAETPGAWITMGFDEDLDAAAKAALRDMIELIRERGKAGRSRP